MPAKSPEALARRRARMREYTKTVWYPANKEKYAKHRRATAARRDAWFRGLKEGKPCLDCGGSFNPWQMDWDHVRGEKLFDPGHKRGSREVILAEIAKCELVCANCHRQREHERRQEKKRQR